MKVMISSDGSTAHFFIRKGWAKAFSYSGHETLMWDIKTKPAFDAFLEFEPDLFIGQAYNVDEAVLKCIKDRPDMKVILKAPDWGDMQNEIDSNIYNVLFAQESDIRTVEKMKAETGKPDFVFVHYTQKDTEKTHNGWLNLGVRTVGLLNASDIFDYTRGETIESLKSDIAFVGGYWGYKSKTFDKYLFPLLDPIGKYNVKIFGNQAWPGMHYCGFIPDDLVRNVFSSATICPNLSEPHSQDFGMDINERSFKILSNKSFCISDYVSSLAEEVFTNNELVFVKSPDEFIDRVDYFIKNPEERIPYIERGYETVMGNHTYFHRTAQICEELGLEKERDDCMKGLENFLGELN